MKPYPPVIRTRMMASIQNEFRRRETRGTRAESSMNHRDTKAQS
jgi:hypothetical protein